MLGISAEGSPPPDLNSQWHLQAPTKPIASWYKRFHNSRDIDNGRGIYRQFEPDVGPDKACYAPHSPSLRAPREGLVSERRGAACPSSPPVGGLLAAADESRNRPP